MTKVITKAILLMGGEGLRFGATLPKQFLRLSGKKIYLHTLDTFLTFPEFQEILLVCHKDWVEEVEKECTSSRVRVLTGGRTRQESSYLGLLACRSETDFVVIHDAVRPFVSKKIIQASLDALKQHLAVDTCIPSQDTIVYAKNLEEITSIPNRLEYLRGQTPQSFSYPLILRAHQKAEIENASDDCRLVLNLGEKVHIVLGSEDNIKITTELDLFLAEQLIRLKTPSPSSAANASLKGKTFAIT
ncbi:MAG: 2-C-methyl-D-erythritol 4-phosphate cytidylyltransferase, partial [Simkania negevensis]|nr:2-C-methyl-D-erythritol 4-phosphate cytidylyltransferase [Simkania negevensis]